MPNICASISPELNKRVLGFLCKHSDDPDKVNKKILVIKAVTAFLDRAEEEDKAKVEEKNDKV